MVLNSALVKIHPHAAVRMQERGALEEEVIDAVLYGEPFAAKFNRTGFRRKFNYNALWKGRRFATKQIEAIAVVEESVWIVVTVVVKYF